MKHALEGLQYPLSVGFFMNFAVLIIKSERTSHELFTFLFRYPPDPGFVALKVFMYLFAICLGMFVGKFFVHKFLLCRVLKLRIFSEEGQGSWMVIFLTVLMFLFIISFIYNEFLLLGGAHFAPYVTTHNLGIQNQTFMKMAAIGTWLGDFITAWMVTDMMLQVRSLKGHSVEAPPVSVIEIQYLARYRHKWPKWKLNQKHL